MYRQLNLLRTEQEEFKSLLRIGKVVVGIGSPVLGASAYGLTNNGWPSAFAAIGAAIGASADLIGTVAIISAKIDLMRLERGREPLNLFDLVSRVFAK